jgi:hypothetical protein
MILRRPILKHTPSTLFRENSASDLNGLARISAREKN